MPASADTVPVFMPPGGPMEVMFSFDTTGSMSGCIAEVKTKVEEIITRLFTDIPGLRISVMAHGDYCDKSTYVTKFVLRYEWHYRQNRIKSISRLVK